MRFLLETLFSGDDKTRRRRLRALTTLAALTLMSVSTSGAQGARPSLRVLRKGTYVTGTTLKPLCFEKQARHDTLRITLRHSELENEQEPRSWPDTLNARVLRLPDDVRHGHHFLRYQLIAVGRGSNMVFGRLGILYPDAEQAMNAPRNADGCLPAGMQLLGELDRQVRLRP